MNDSVWLPATVRALECCAPHLFRLYIEAPALTFEAGQFTKLALDIQGERVARAYSFVNAPNAPLLEFYFSVVPQGPLSPRLAQLRVGDPIWVGAQPNGFLVLSEVPPASTLWLLATGTGIGPFISILEAGALWQRYANVVLVHAVRKAAELSYTPRVHALQQTHGSALRYVPMVSREAQTDTLTGRIPARLIDGSLEHAAGVVMTATDSQVMLCGNPAMVREVVDTLASRGMKKHRRRTPGQITVENYW